MEVFDYNKFDAVGIAKKLGTANHGAIYCVGMVNRETGVFTYVAPEHRSKVFPTKGRIFAYEFFSHHPEMKDECICLCAKPNANESIVNGEDFVWDWKDKPYVYGDKLIETTEPIVEDGQRNVALLEKYGILKNKEVDTYFISGEYLYCYSPDSRLMPYWDLAKLSDAIIWLEHVPYLIKNIQIDEKGCVDITSDEQLIVWYKKKILRKEWNTIYEAKDFNAINNIISDELKSINLPTNVFESRLSRFLRINANISLTFEELEDLSGSQWFSDVVANTVKQFSDKFIEKIKSQHAEKIEQIRRETHQEIEKSKAEKKVQLDGIELDIALKKEELDNLSKRIETEEKSKKAEVLLLDEKIKALGSQLKEREAAINKIEERKSSLLEDFSIVKDVLSFQTGVCRDAAPIFNNIEVLNKMDKEVFDDVGAFRKNINAYLKYFKCHKIDVDNILTQLTMRNILLLPDELTVNAIMHATRNCRYCVEYVGVGWKSFNDLWENGLSAIVKSAVSTPGVSHFLALKGINMSYLPTYLQPVIDLQNGLISKFPGTEHSFPKNLRILCTRTKEKVIPISSGSLEGIGCVSIEEELTFSERKGIADSLTELSFLQGYIPSSLLSRLPVKPDFFDRDQTAKYIDEY